MKDQLQHVLDEAFDKVPVERIRKNAFHLTFLYFAVFFALVLAFGMIDVPGESSAEMAPYATAWATEIAMADPGHPLKFPVPGSLSPIGEEWPTERNIDQPACPQGGLVPHPCREPDNLRVVRISRYDPSLGGPNCFKFVNGICVSNMANGEDWRPYFEIAAACSPEWPFGTIFEIGEHRWVCKDRGGKIVQSPAGVYWVDLLSKNAGAYGLAFGDVITVSVWWPE